MGVCFKIKYYFTSLYTKNPQLRINIRKNRGVYLYYMLLFRVSFPIVLFDIGTYLAYFEELFFPLYGVSTDPYWPEDIIFQYVSDIPDNFVFAEDYKGEQSLRY